MFTSSKSSVAALLLAAGFGLPGPFGPDVTVQAQTGQKAAISDNDFVGTWNWMFQDRRFATMTLQRNGDQFGGSITNGSIQMDKDGRITSASAGEGSSSILRSSFQNGALHIVAKDGNEEMELAMILKSPTTGEVKFAGQDAPLNAQAIKVEKVWSEPPLRP